MSGSLGHYREVWAVDFEFHAPTGERPDPRCMVARELRSGRSIRVWADELARTPAPPFPTGPDTLFVAYYASAELGCFRTLGWTMPARILDLYTEFRRLTNGQTTVSGNGLLGALAHFGLGAVDATEKSDMRDLAIRGGSFSEAERTALLEYCESDVVALSKLLPAMLPFLDVPRALVRGRYMAAVAAMEWVGTPVDVAALEKLRGNWGRIKSDLVRSIDSEYGVYDGTTFKQDRFTNWLERVGIPWPRLPSGALALDDETFREMARIRPVLSPLRELRQSLSGMRLFSGLAVGHDWRNRCLLSPFRSITGRNQPRNASFIFGPSAWLRGLIKPEPGTALAYVDWSQQEFGTAAALSDDPAMMEAYRSGDPYLRFAVQADAVPPDARRDTHPTERERFKACTLAVQYGMAEQSLATRIGQPEPYARRLLDLHRRTYPRYWKWSQAAVDHAMIHGWLDTVFGWRVHVGPRVNARSLANFPMQANGAEMLRLACCLLTERGVCVCCPVHDAVLVEGPINEIDEVVEQTQAAMAEASRIVLGGFELRSDAKIVRYPDRYMDPRGQRMWESVWSHLHQHGAGTCTTPAHPSPLIISS